jgi:hypothetical protein
MLNGKFDPFGEPLQQAPASHAQLAPSVLGRVGQSVFWLLAISIVLARVLWLSPTSPF